MKNYIYYYYQLDVENLRYVHGKYFFHDLKNQYILESTYYSKEILQDIYYLQKFLQSKQFYCHEIIKNTASEICTIIDGKCYVLLKIENNSDKQIEMEDILLKQNVVANGNDFSRITYFPWFHLWESKIDYYEQYFSSRRELSFDEEVLLQFFIGIGENAISYLKDTLKSVSSISEINLIPSHRRVYCNMSFIDFYNPLNLILDVQVRDIAEYLKNSFWMNCYNLQQIEITLDKVNFSKIEAQIFFSRLLFPSFYFDYIENNDVPKDLEGRITEYLLFILDIYTYLRKKYAINEIKWLNKKI